jgi:hypothetical protein
LIRFHDCVVCLKKGPAVLRICERVKDEGLAPTLRRACLLVVKLTLHIIHRFAQQNYGENNERWKAFNEGGFWVEESKTIKGHLLRLSFLFCLQK